MKVDRHDRNTAVLGMWIFLSTEALLFSVLLLSIFIYRHLHTPEFAVGTQHLDRVMGAINTGILLTSSWTMARAVHFSENEKPDKVFAQLGLTFALGIIFLVLKGHEYLQHAHEGFLPVFNWHPPGQAQPALQLFFVLYFLATGLHAIHLLIGCGLAGGAAMLSLFKLKRFPLWLENIGLYWHFVDLVWVWLFPLLYLVGRNK